MRDGFREKAGRRRKAGIGVMLATLLALAGTTASAAEKPAETELDAVVVTASRTSTALVVRAENNVIHGNMSVLSIYYAQTKTFSNFQ